MATHSSILGWQIPWTEEPGGLYTVHRVAKSRTRLKDCTHTHTHTHTVVFQATLLTCVPEPLALKLPGEPVRCRPRALPTGASLRGWAQSPAHINSDPQAGEAVF